MDHGLRQFGEDGRQWFAYGGDFGEEPHDGNFCVDGLLTPDRQEKSGIVEYKKILEPAKVIDVDISKGKIKIKNMLDFISLSFLRCSYSLMENGKAVEQGELENLDIKPKEEGNFSLLLNYNMKPDKEYFINFSFAQKYSTLWSKTGFIVCRSQLPVKKAETSGDTVCINEFISVDDKDHSIEILGENFSVTFDKFKGKLEKYTFNGVSLLEEGLEENFYRAPTDNDGCRPGRQKDEWRKEGLDRLSKRIKNVEVVKISSNEVKISVEGRFSAKAIKPVFDTAVVYTVNSWGEIEVKTEFTPLRDISFIPKMGMKFAMSNQFEYISWYGRGPHQNYSDMKESALVGLYNTTVSEDYVDYIYPQEYGNKCDVRWAEITNITDIGIKITGNPTINFSAHPYSLDNLANAEHTTDLEKSDKTHIYVDYKQCGLGSNSCGPLPMEKYRLYPEKASYSFTIKPFIKWGS